MNDLIAGCIALAAYKALNQAGTGVKPLPLAVREACWRTFDPWWNANQIDDMRQKVRNF